MIRTLGVFSMAFFLCTMATAGAPYLIKDIAPGSASSSPGLSAIAAGRLYFAANDGADGNELWRTDGTAAGTIFVRDIYAGASSASFRSMFALDDRLLFSVDDGTHGFELWASDGTSAGTGPVRDIWPGSSSSYPSAFEDLNGVALFFALTDWSIPSYVVMRSDGTHDGTYVVSSLGFWLVRGHVVWHDAMYFASTLLDTGGSLWRTDGTDPGTSKVRQFRADASNTPYGLIALNDLLLLVADNGTSGYELFRSDGTQGGTKIVKDILPGNGNGVQGAPVAWRAGNKALFPANDGATGIELWLSDGTAAGTSIVKDINPGLGISSPADVIDAGDFVFFSASPDGVNRRVWRSDGTEAGTRSLSEVALGAAGGLRSPITIEGMVFFSADDGQNGRRLWQTDGTVSGTRIVPGSPLMEITSAQMLLSRLGSRLIFAGTTPELGNELWAMDLDDDGDGVLNWNDNCPNVYNPDQADSNHDGVGDACEVCDPCDTNCDGSLNQFDIAPFVEALVSQSGCSACAADVNGDGSINQFDVQGFVECLIGP